MKFIDQSLYYVGVSRNVEFFVGKNYNLSEIFNQKILYAIEIMSFHNLKISLDDDYLQNSYLPLNFREVVRF